jgi:hypothetical protein
MINTWDTLFYPFKSYIFSFWNVLIKRDTREINRPHLQKTDIFFLLIRQSPQDLAMSNWMIKKEELLWRHRRTLGIRNPHSKVSAQGRLDESTAENAVVDSLYYKFHKYCKTLKYYSNRNNRLHSKISRKISKTFDTVNAIWFDQLRYLSLVTLSSWLHHQRTLHVNKSPNPSHPNPSSLSLKGPLPQTPPIPMKSYK